MTTSTTPIFAFPAKAGTQGCSALCFLWTPAFAGEAIWNDDGTQP
jgi:hypothetical protein